MSDEENFKPSASKKIGGQETKVSEPEAKAAEPQRLRLVCTPRTLGSLVDPDRNVRIPANGQNPVEVSGPIAEGSWLDCQVKAGLIKVIN